MEQEDKLLIHVSENVLKLWYSNISAHSGFQGSLLCNQSPGGQQSEGIEVVKVKVMKAHCKNPPFQVTDLLSLL